jgi:hypothetical protein
MGDLKSTHLPVFVINVFWSGLRVALWQFAPVRIFRENIGTE